MQLPRPAKHSRFAIADVPPEQRVRIHSIVTPMHGSRAKLRADMLSDYDATATIAVKDLKAARKFYEEILGFKASTDDDHGAISYRSGNTALLVYQSKVAGTNQATAVTWTVDDVGAIVRGLTAKGVRFEHYDMPGVTRNGDIHVAGNHQNAWFKDPDGNIISIVSHS